MGNNAQPLKKEILAEEKEVKEFDSCRKTLKDNVKVEAGVKDTREIQSVKKKETSLQCAPAVNEKEAGKACEEEKTEGDEEEEEVNVVEIVESKKKSPEKVAADSDTAEKASCNDENAKREAEEAEVKVGESERKVNASEAETATLPERSLMSPSNASESSSEVEWEMSEEEEEEVLPSKPISPIKERSPVREKANPEPVIATKEIPSLLLMSPAVRRRGEVSSSNCVSVSASIRLPPPPSFRPPPPPLSPPVTLTKDLASEKSLRLVNKDESSEEEESEWEYESESEEE